MNLEFPSEKKCQVQAPRRPIPSDPRHCRSRRARAGPHTHQDNPSTPRTCKCDKISPKSATNDKKSLDSLFLSAPLSTPNPIYVPCNTMKMCACHGCPPAQIAFPRQKMQQKTQKGVDRDMLFSPFSFHPHQEIKPKKKKKKRHLQCTSVEKICTASHKQKKPTTPTPKTAPPPPPRISTFTSSPASPS